jgi:isopenicillin-N epimerase
MFGLKNHFLLDPSVTFLNHGSFGATPRPVFAEYQHWQRELENQPVEFLGRRVTGLLAGSRERLGRYLGTCADNLVYTQNVTISLNIIARSLRLGAGDVVLASEHEYGAMDRMWRYISHEQGFSYRTQAVDLSSRAAWVDSFWSGVTSNTRILFLSHITSPTAILFPVEEIISRARQAGIVTILDGAHVPGQIQIELDHLGADFYGGNLHKWLCAPKGAGFLYARPEMQCLVKPLVVSWGYEPEISSGSDFIDLHEWWGTRDVAAFLSVPAAIDFQAAHDWDHVRMQCHELLLEAQNKICALTGIPPLHSSTGDWFIQMATAPLPDEVDLPSLKIRLYDEYRIEVPVIEWMGRKLIRISIQGYNTRREVKHLIKALDRSLSLRGRSD